MITVVFSDPKITCFEMNCLTSSSVVVEPFDCTTKATGTSPAFSSIMLNKPKQCARVLVFCLINRWRNWTSESFHEKYALDTYETTAASDMLGWVSNIASSSAGATWKPLYLIISFNRSTINSSSSSSMYPISPVWSQPSLSMVLSVDSGSLR